MSAKTVSGYLNAVPKAHKTALSKLRKQIKSAAPKAVEGIGYGMPSYKFMGHPMVYFGSASTWCSFYPSSIITMRSLKKDLKGYETSKGTIRFSPEKGLPTSLVTKIVKARMAEIKARWG